MAASALFILDLKGSIILYRDYRGDVPIKFAERFISKLNELEEAGKVHTEFYAYTQTPQRPVTMPDASCVAQCQHASKPGGMQPESMKLGHQPRDVCTLPLQLPPCTHRRMLQVTPLVQVDIVSYMCNYFSNLHLLLSLMHVWDAAGHPNHPGRWRELHVRAVLQPVSPRGDPGECECDVHAALPAQAQGGIRALLQRVGGGILARQLCHRLRAPR